VLERPVLERAGCAGVRHVIALDALKEISELRYHQPRSNSIEAAGSGEKEKAENQHQHQHVTT